MVKKVTLEKQKFDDDKSCRTERWMHLMSRLLSYIPRRRLPDYIQSPDIRCVSSGRKLGLIMIEKNTCEKEIKT